MQIVPDISEVIITTETILNDDQKMACTNIYNFLKSSVQYDFLLLGCAGSGKTTTIINALNTILNYKIIFTAFTNKAVSVLKKISQKYITNFVPEFTTIHKLLGLEQSYDVNGELCFKFNKKNILHLNNYDIIIFDECSTISEQLFTFINDARKHIEFLFNKKLKFIFLGDFYQLPPIGEDISVIFKTSINDKWLVSKLSRSIRSSNKKMSDIYDLSMNLINKFKQNDCDDFIKKYPTNMINGYIYKYNELDMFLKLFIHTWNNITSDVVILTFSRINCNKLNYYVQDLIDINKERTIPDDRTNIIFYAGDRCVIDRPIEVYQIKEYIDDGLICLDGSLSTTLYNGEIFDILEVRDVKVVTNLHTYKYINPFDGQILTVKKIYEDKIYKIVHINHSQLEEAKSKIKSNERKYIYIQMMEQYYKMFPILNYGYCVTIYKTQGSEYNTVFINLNSIKWSIVGAATENISKKKKLLLFKSTYTAITRTSHELHCIW